MKKYFILSLAVLMFASANSIADDSDIFSYAIEPNVLILFDSSGSMENYIETNPYDPDTTYPGPFTNAYVYRSTRRGYRVYSTSVAAVPSSRARNALNTVGYWNGRIYGSYYRLSTGNYRNYRFSGGSTLEKKSTVAKRVVTNLINNTDGVRFGVLKFRRNGAEMVAEIGTSKATLISAVNGITRTSVGTPLGDMMYDAGRYYKGSFGSYTDPIQYECQPNFIIMISDGMENSTTRSVITEAGNRFGQDHASTIPGNQNVVVHTVGFAIADSEELVANDTLRAAADNGNGEFFSTENQADLETALQDVIGQILSGTYSFASPLIPTTSTTGSNKLFLAAFQSNPFSRAWRGFLKAYRRQADGTVLTDANGVPLDSELVWEAGNVLNSTLAANRNIYTVISGSRVDFKITTSAITTTDLSASSSSHRNDIIAYIRGLDILDEDNDNVLNEERPWKLGDIFHSAPVLVGAPPLSRNDSGYPAFKTTNAGRTKVVYTAANDGQIHAFRESDGVELWSFIPPSQLSRLKMLMERGDHEFYVDSSPIAADIQISGAWKTVILVGERRGGRNYHLLDVTNPTNPQLLWSFTDSLLGETWSEPRIGEVKMSDGTTKWVAFIGGGYDTENNNASGKTVMAIDLATGNKIWQYYNNSSSDDRQYMNFSFAASPALVDSDGDGKINTVYIGDVGGQMWKFDVSAAATLSAGMITNWTGKRMFAAAPSQANPPPTGEYFPAQGIYSAPIMAYYNNDIWMYFGTGDRNHPNNLTTVNRFYGIKENTNMTNGSALTESSLVNNTTTNNSVTQGWYITLGTGEKVLAQGEVFNDIIYFTSFTPNTSIVCNGVGGPSKLYAVELGTGYAAVEWPSGKPLSSTDASKQRATTAGTGIPSAPIVTLTETGGAMTSVVIVGTTSGQLPANPAPSPNLKRMLYWREVF